MSIELLTLQDAENLSHKQTFDLFCEHINPSLGKMMNMLGFATKRPVRAENTHILFDDGAEVLDFTAQFGIMNVGHNHPRILAARKQWADRRALEIWKFFPSPYQAVLAKNIASIFPEDLDVVFFCNSGAEANEGALKMASKVAGSSRDLVVHTDISFHGKTHATLSVSGSESKQNKFFKLLPGCISVPFGDIDAFERILKEHKPSFGKTRVSTFIVEAIRAEGVHVPPEGYLQRVRELCDEFNVTLIVDEVFTGFGRTGKMFAFNHSGITPDIVSFSKTFGGGKATFGGYVARKKLFKKAYGSMNEATLHSTTYNGYGEEIVSAIEVINILHEEKLVENAEKQGKYLLEKLTELKEKHPIVKDVRAVGLLCCIRFENTAAKLAKFMPGEGSSHVVAKLTTGGIISQLFEHHNILTYTPPHDFDLLFLTPPLTITSEHIDQLVDALDVVLKLNMSETSQTFMKRYMEK
ncbi:MAG: aminotransferase class III-fold pyridoxal phosphate-dependent enzyme [Pseudomonadales bacterium]|nr:aminotransferase class III-fold pyridoxal phosphate-dependent enzyme [Pseudomonadales bacterium]